MDSEQSSDEVIAASRQRYNGAMESDVSKSKLRNEISMLRQQISTFESRVNEISTDPSGNMPSKANLRRRLPKLKVELQRLKSRHESQCELLENIEEMGNADEAMRRAASTGDETTVKRLLSRGVDVNRPDGTGYNAFFYCCGQGHVRIAEMMISNGEANVDYSDPTSNTFPLLLAASKCQLGIVRLLLENEARADQRDGSGRTALLAACEKDCTGCVETLLSHKANPNMMDQLNGNTGLHHAATNGNDCMARLLVEHGASVSIRNRAGQTALAIARSLRHFKVVDAISTKPSASR